MEVTCAGTNSAHTVIMYAKSIYFKPLLQYQSFAACMGKRRMKIHVEK